MPTRTGIPPAKRRRCGRARGLALAALAAPCAAVPNYDVLRELYEATGGAAWRDNSNWLDNNAPCNSWAGLECADFHANGLGPGPGREFVKQIRFDGNGLRGMPPCPCFSSPRRSLCAS
jgi:hypothetical protein